MQSGPLGISQCLQSTQILQILEFTVFSGPQILNFANVFSARNPPIPEFTVFSAHGVAQILNCVKVWLLSPLDLFHLSITCQSIFLSSPNYLQGFQTERSLICFHHVYLSCTHEPPETINVYRFVHGFLWCVYDFFGDRRLWFFGGRLWVFRAAFMILVALRLSQRECSFPLCRCVEMVGVWVRVRWGWVVHPFYGECLGAFLLRGEGWNFFVCWREVVGADDWKAKSTRTLWSQSQ